jgi:hypothetical protein
MVGGVEVDKDMSCTSTEIGFLASLVADFSTSVTEMERMDIEAGDMQMRHLIESLRLGEQCIVDGE